MRVSHLRRSPNERTNNVLERGNGTLSRIGGGGACFSLPASPPLNLHAQVVCQERQRRPLLLSGGGATTAFLPPPSLLSKGGKSSADDGRQKEEDGAEAVSHGRFEEEGFLSSPPPFCEVALGRVTSNIGGFEMTG